MNFAGAIVGVNAALYPVTCNSADNVSENRGNGSITFSRPVKIIGNRIGPRSDPCGNPLSGLAD